MFLYIRCAIENRAILAGYICLATATALALVVLNLPEDALAQRLGWVAASGLWLGCVLLATGNFGRNTVKAYRKAAAELDRDFRRSTFVERWRARPYCFYRGAMLALKDHYKKHPPGD